MPITALKLTREYGIDQPGRMVQKYSGQMPTNPGAAIGLPVVSSPATGSRPSKLEEVVVAMFDRHRTPLLRYLLSLRIGAPDAEEIVQEVFLSLFRHLQCGKSRANLHGWVFRVAHNLALKNRLKAQTQSPVAVAEEQVHSAPDPEVQLAESQRQHRLLAVVKALPELDRCCLSLRAEGLRYRAIAEALGISLGAVANSLEKSLSRLNRADENN
jgi:RNA polymerase sigma-70 factor (ECF subfamily)